MYRSRFLARCAALLLVSGIFYPLASDLEASAQSGRKPPEKARKAEERSTTPTTPAEEQEPKVQEAPAADLPPLTPDDLKDAIQLNAEVVNVETVVYEKKSGRILQNLTQENFKVFEDGVEQNVVNFVPTEGPITLVVLIEFSRRIDNAVFRKREVLEPAYYFVSKFVQEKDNIAIVAFDMRPEVITDFTNSPQRLSEGIMFLNRNHPGFNESNVWDALKFVIEGGKIKDEEYAGLKGVNRRSAVMLISLGIDTFSKTGYDDIRRIIGNAGIPIYTVGIGNWYHKRYEHQMPAEMNLTFLQAQNALRSFARATGGEYFPITFASEIPTNMQSIANLLRNQYSLGYTPTNTRREGKQRKIEVKVDVDGDGKFGDKDYKVQHREVYVEPRDPEAK